MCGRYNLITDAQALMDFLEVENGLQLAPRYNIAPSQQVPIVRYEGQARVLAMVRWGLIPHWAKNVRVGYRMINARAETVAEKPSFRTAFRRRRCLIPATGFYEWKSESGGRQPYLFRLDSGGLMAFAGLWEQWQGSGGEPVHSCTIIVTEANGRVQPIHDRMPVILDRREHTAWLAPDNNHASALLPLLRPCPDDWLIAHPVSCRVGNPANDGPDCIQDISVIPLFQQ